VVSLGIFSVVPSDKTMCPEVEWKLVPGISPGVKAAGAYGWRPTTLVVPKFEKIGALTYPEPLGPPRPVARHLYFFFVMKFYMFRTVPLPIIRSLFTVHSAMVYVIQVCRQLSSRTRMESCQQTCMTYTIAECTVNKLLMMDRGTVRNM